MCPEHLTAIPLRSKAAGELVPYHPTASPRKIPPKGWLRGTSGL
jgi:hypothetical protein